MAGLLSRITKGAEKKPAADGEPAELDPIRADDQARRVALLDSLENSGLGWFWASDAEGRLTYLTPKALEMLELEETDVVGRQVSELFEEDTEIERDEAQRPLRFMLAARNSINASAVKLTAGDKSAWWEISGKPHFCGDGTFEGYRGSIKDISRTHQDRVDAERLSQFDSLTGLSNRHRMARNLTSTLKAFTHAKRSCALMMLDLDRFKQVNDTLGHPAGDELLKQVAARIQRIIGDEGEIGRLGGDEFQIILPDYDDRGELGELGQRLIQMVSQPYSIGGSRAVIGSSVGIAVAPYDGVETDELIKAADLALYAAKGGGRGQHRFYSSDLQDKASHRHQIEADLRDAAAKNELLMYYQPIVDAKTHEVVCMEALMRWDHSERGMISPAEFIPVAEDVGLIRELGEWALNEVCQQVAKWPNKVKAAINVSAVQFASDDFVEVVRTALKRSGVNPQQIELEITESVFVGDIERTLLMFKNLKELGIRLALDDFGTGYSSLSYLRDAPFDKIKIDQGFVRGCSSGDNNNLAIIAAVVSLASVLRMETVAEGVETKDELAAVTGQGATHLQGILFSRAVPIEEVTERFEKGDLVYVPRGPEKFRADRRTEFRKIGLIHGDHRYTVILRNLSKTGAKVEGLLDVPLETKVVLDLGGGQLAVATVKRSEGYSQGVEFETPLISDGADGLCTRHRVSPYQMELAGRPLQALNDDSYAGYMHAQSKEPKAFMEVQLSGRG
ncbi:bifunctional diguanylate cyclase/phosphodiesterase [Erythrobacter sp. YT30]|uniref:putative bifunctional diguanylate cyclase/phosphodiesterase n=1 Tax=Erythrobacter sp. YT30 TaxID=1735012 RepID=UPI00076D4B7E|nr:EAL domain-containing protein [Erythrobacter sp. YT30]KWV93154.1 diguanylate phosphodiesterase [Erythrobacter sp. YT30]